MRNAYRQFGGRLAGILAIVLLVQNLHASEAVFDRLGAEIEQDAASKGLPLLSVVLVDESGPVWSFGTGQNEAPGGESANSRTTYRIGSVSKLFTDIAIMQLVERGALDLDEPVVTYLPGFRPANPFGVPITLRMLMSHSSGLVREPPVGNYFDPELPSLAATVESLNRTELVYEPGTKVQYSNAGIAVVGRVIEKLAGQPFATELRERILRPLGMQNSSFTPEESVVARLPTAYMWSYQGDRTPAPTFELGMAPAGSMYSNMDDLARFIQALIDRGEGRDGRILREATLEEMWTPQTNMESARGRGFGIGFGLGTLDGERAVSHGGAIYGFATQLKVLPDRKVGVAVATNLDMANGAINRIADHALRVVLAVKDGEAVPSLATTEPVPESLAAELVGLYQKDDQVIEVMRRFGDLYVERLGGLSLRLRALDGGLVIDDLMSFNDDVHYEDGILTIRDNVFEAIATPRPAPANRAWTDFLGEYGYDHNILYVSEKRGKLHALIEWGMEYPLEDLGAGKFKLPPYGLYPNETLLFERNGKGKVVNVSLSGVDFARRPVGDITGEVFRIDPVEPVAVLERLALKATPPREAGPFRKADLVDITEYSDNIRLDIRYATDANFLGVPVYPSAEAFLQRPAAEALSRISKHLEILGYGLLVHDAYRPWYVTKVFWDATPEESKRFVADPSQGSRHNRGCAIDLTLYDLETGEPIDMVGVYDEMSPRSYPHYPGGTSLQRWHRELLRSAMEAEGFDVYEFEWWHFDFRGWEQYAIETQTFESID